MVVFGLDLRANSLCLFSCVPKYRPNKLIKKVQHVILTFDYKLVVSIKHMVWIGGEGEYKLCGENSPTR